MPYLNKDCARHHIKGLNWFGGEALVYPGRLLFLSPTQSTQALDCGQSKLSTDSPEAFQREIRQIYWVAGTGALTEDKYSWSWNDEACWNDTKKIYPFLAPVKAPVVHRIVNSRKNGKSAGMILSVQKKGGAMVTLLSAQHLHQRKTWPSATDIPKFASMV